MASEGSIRAISLWQPWASFLVYALKNYETRHWDTKYRGPLVIHAAKRWTGAQQQAAWDIWERFPETTVVQDFTRGALVGMVRVVEVVSTEVGAPSELEAAVGDWTPGRFAWRCLGQDRFRRPIPYKGRQGFFSIDPAILANQGHWVRDLIGAAR